MANIQSQIKRNRQTETARVRNKARRSELKTYLKRVETLVAEGDAEGSRAALREASQKLDKAVSAGLVKKNAAANKKSRLAARVNAL